MHGDHHTEFLISYPVSAPGPHIGSWACPQGDMGQGEDPQTEKGNCHIIICCFTPFIFVAFGSKS